MTNECELDHSSFVIRHYPSPVWKRDGNRISGVWYCFVMHELAIAQSIREIVEGAVPPDQAANVRAVRIRVGRLSGVVADSLDFCFNVIVADTPLCRARLLIELVPTVSQCSECSHRFTVEDLAFVCPSCGSTGIALVSGTELQVADIELEDNSVEVT